MIRIYQAPVCQPRDPYGHREAEDYQQRLQRLLEDEGKTVRVILTDSPAKVTTQEAAARKLGLTMEQLRAVQQETWDYCIRFSA